MQKQKLKIIRGDDDSVRVTVQGAGSITQADLHAKVRNQVVLRLSSTDGSIVIDDNALILHFSHEKTRDLTFSFADYDLQIITDGKRRTIMGGELTLVHDITQV